jgi:hypothetical protein
MGKYTKRVRFSRRKGRKHTSRSKKIVLTPKPILLNGAPKEVKIEELDLDAPMKLKKNATVIGIIYAKWCPHCKDLIPDENDTTSPPKWKQTIDSIKLMKDRKRDLFYAQLEEGDIKKDGKLDKLNEKCRGICPDPVVANGYPTVFRVSGGKVETYDGLREPKEMASWLVRGDLGPPLPPPIGK